MSDEAQKSSPGAVEFRNPQSAFRNRMEYERQGRLNDE
jgi:hypothetical protein